MNRLLQSCVGDGAAGKNPGTTSATAGDGSVNGVLHLSIPSSRAMP
jgi:hypothetical protein